MEWRKDKIRELRLRMGWSQSDLARRLNCELQEIEFLEQGAQEPTPLIRGELDLIFMNCEECSFEVMGQPIAEQILDGESLGQINLSEVKDVIQ